jgi:type IV pilus assembly protein PilC
MDADGKIQRGRLEAVNPLDLELRLRRMSLDLVNSKLAYRGRRLSFRAPVDRPELINFCFHLQQLLRAGVRLTEALRDLRDSVTHAHFREVLADVIEEIDGGKELSQALAGHPDVFDSVFVNLVRTGEKSGQLPDVLYKLTENLKWQDEIKAQTRKIVLYPLFSGAVVIGMLFFLMLYLVPKLGDVIRTMTPTLSLQTRALLATSKFFVDNYHWLLLSPFALVAVLFLLRRLSHRLQYRWDALKFRIPALGPVLRKIILARFATFFSLMFASGIGILECIRISEKIVGNRVIEQGLQQVGRAIADGRSLTEGFRSVGLFPPLVLRMLNVGETTGNLDTALLNVSYFYNRDVKESIDSVQQLLQPVLMLVVGALMMLVLVPVFGPIYDAVSKIPS